MILTACRLLVDASYLAICIAVHVKVDGSVSCSTADSCSDATQQRWVDGSFPGLAPESIAHSNHKDVSLRRAPVERWLFTFPECAIPSSIPSNSHHEDHAYPFGLCLWAIATPGVRLQHLLHLPELGRLAFMHLQVRGGERDLQVLRGVEQAPRVFQ
jgi:hypothetical protein